MTWLIKFRNVAVYHHVIFHDVFFSNFSNFVRVTLDFKPV